MFPLDGRGALLSARAGRGEQNCRCFPVPTLPSAEVIHGPRDSDHADQGTPDSAERVRVEGTQKQISQSVKS